jgi:hypothetical protein
MKNTMKNYIFAAMVIGFTAFSGLSTASAAVYYDQLGQPHYYDTYTVPGGQFGGLTTSQYYPPAQYGYNANGTSYAYSYSGYNNGYNSTANSYANRPPVIFSSPVREAVAGQPYIAGINASDPDQDTLTYSVVNGPTGMYINPNTGLLRWNDTAGKAGQDFPVTVSVTDGRSAPVTQSFTILVRGSSASSSGSNGSQTSPSGSSSYTSSAFGSIFGKSKPKDIVISNVNVISGPKDINDKEERNCNVNVTWTTNLATAGQVVYGATSQQSLENYSYPNSAPEGNAFAKEHQVKLGCLANTSTYFFRIVAFSDTARIASPEYTIFPVTVRTNIPGNGFTANVTESSSFFGELFRFIFNPIILTILILILLGYAFFRFVKYNNAKAARIKAKQEAQAAAPVHGGHADAHGVSSQIPMLQIPHA